MGALKYYDTGSSSWKYITNNPATAGIILSEELTGTVNGTNPIFTTTQPFDTIDLYKNGVHMRPGASNDYVKTGANQVTFNTAPAVGSSINGSYATTGVSNVAGVNSFIFKETPAGLVNGSNGTFTTARPYVPGTLLAHKNGLTQGNLVTETNPAAGTFTMDAPLTGDHISVTYQYAASVSGNADTVDGFHANSTPTTGQLFPLVAKTVDANGWTVNDMGTFKIYTKRVTTTLSGFNGPAFISGLGSNLPVGIANFNATQAAHSSFHYNGSGNMRVVQEGLTTGTGFAVVGTTSAAYTGSLEANYTVIA